MSDLLQHLLSSDGFMPHGYCYLWDPGLVRLHLASDALIALSYTSIPFTLAYVVRKRKDIPFDWMILCFGLFIIACGATHYMEIWTLWRPTYWLSGIIKAVTALASVPTAILLIRLVPNALAIPTPQQLHKANEELSRAHAALEERVLQRTAELTRKNEELAAEIAERKRVQEALARSELRFRRLLDAGIIGIITADIHGNIMEANDAFLQMVGYSTDDVRSGKVRWDAMTPEEWRHLDDRAIQQLQVTGTAAAWEKEYFRKDGARVPILLGVTILDSPAECVAFVVDLTERKRAEAALRESEARKTAVMEAALDAILLLDHEGKIIDFNPAAQKTFGYAGAEVLGRPLGEMLIPSSERERHQDGFRHYLETAQGSVVSERVEVTAMRKDGTEFPAEVAVVRIRSQGPAIFTGYIRDITLRRKAAEAEMLRAAKEAAEEANAELEAFSYSVAHDLRTPLRAINGFSSALLEDLGDKLNPEARDHLNRIMIGADRMAHLIDALLGLARLTRTDPRPERVDLTQLAHSVMAQIRSVDARRTVEFVAAEGLVDQGDPQLLRALMENLLGNAWKFTAKQDDARIEFGREEYDGMPAYYVRDNGAGFDMTHVGKLFAPFRRLHAAEDYEGTGIGLATVHRIVRRHGGRIWAEGRENLGAIFHFTLSAAQQAAKVPGARSWMQAR
jgi:PAS domain S-box-containing protein